LTAAKVSFADVSNVLNEDKQKQVIALGQLGWPLRRIEKQTGVRRETAAGYLKAAGIAVRPPRGWGRKPPSKPAKEVTTDSAAAKPANGAGVTTDFGAAPVTRSPAASACTRYHELIEFALARGRNAMAIWQDLVDQHGFTGAYESVKRYVRRLRGAHTPEARAVILTAPGEEGQADYGTGPMVRDPETGKYRRTRLFVLTLGYSRKSVRFLVFRSSAQIWAELHERAFRRLGGSPRVLVLDNLREGVRTPDIYDVTVNPLYRDLLAHYGAVAMPCRVRDPDRKGKVESGVAHAQKTPLKGLRFETLAAAQACLDHWEERWADSRIHGTTKRQVSDMFAEEKPALLPLPLEPFRFYKYGERTVHLDGCVEVEAAYYSVPPGSVGQRVNVQWDDHRVRILNPRTGQLLREHLRQPRGRHRIHRDDRPKRSSPGIVRLLAQAHAMGVHIGAVCDVIHARDGVAAVRRIQGVLGFARKYGAARLDATCAMAIEFNLCSYRFVRRHLEHHAEPPVSLRQIDPIIRQLTLYCDLIRQRTEESSHERS
jgi:transposase